MREWVGLAQLIYWESIIYCAMHLLNPFYSVINDRNLPRSNTMPGGTKIAEISETSTGAQNLERSKTERRRPNPHPTAQLFDGKISDKKKVWTLFHFLLSNYFRFLIWWRWNQEWYCKFISVQVQSLHLSLKGRNNL